MQETFSDFVRSLEPDGEPTPTALDELWTELRRLLLRELRRRGLADSPPRHLGVVGDTRWTTPETRDARGMPVRTRDALDELTADAYAEIFLERLPNLRRYVAGGQSVEAVVVRGVRQFLHTRQKSDDRLGFRVFQDLRSALEEMADTGRLTILEGGEKTGNATVFAFQASFGEAPAPSELPTAEVGRWNNELLPLWLGSAGGDRKRLIRRLRDHIAGLEAVGIGIFSFKTLVDALKFDLRARLVALWGEPSEMKVTEGGEALRRAVEEGRLRELSECVETGLVHLAVQRRTRDQLEKLWRFLVDFAATAEDPDNAASCGEAMARALSSDDLPSNRELSRLLGIRADRFPALFARLKSEVERCLGELREAPILATVGAAGGGSAGSSRAEAALDDSRDLRRELQRRTAEAWHRGAGSEPPSGPPRPGDLYLLAACPEPGVEWVLLEQNPSAGESAGEALLVPADSLGWAGGADVAAAGETAAGPLTLRCGHGLWLGGEVLAGERRSGALAARDLERAREHRQSWLRGAAEATAEQRETGADPDYRDWCRTLEAARQAVCRAHAGRLDERPESTAETAEPEPAPEDEKPPAEIHPFERKPAKTAEGPPFRRFLALAAAVMLILVAGWLLGKLFDEGHLERRLARLQTELEAAQASERRLSEELDAEKTRAEEERERLGERHQEEIGSLEEGFEQQIARLEEPGPMPWMAAPPGVQRGSPIELPVPPEARFFGLLLEAEAGDRVEIRAAGGGVVVEQPIDQVFEGEVMLRLPASRLPPGEYVVEVSRGGETRSRFRLRTVRP